MHREPLHVGIRSARRCHFESTLRNNAVFFQETLTKLASGFNNGRSPRCWSHRSPTWCSLWQRGIPDSQVYGLDIILKGIVSNLRLNVPQTGSAIDLITLHLILRIRIDNVLY